jgi:hypothetical protein
MYYSRTGKQRASMHSPEPTVLLTFRRRPSTPYHSYDAFWSAKREVVSFPIQPHFSSNDILIRATVSLSRTRFRRWPARVCRDACLYLSVLLKAMRRPLVALGPSVVHGYAQHAQPCTAVFLVCDCLQADRSS